MTMPADIPRIRVRAATGRLIIRDGVNINLFLRESHSKLATRISELLQQFWHFSNGRFDLFYLDDEGEFRKVTDTTITAVVSDMTSHRGFEFFACDSDSECAGHAFHYFGIDRESPFFADWPNVVSALQIRLPTEHVVQMGWDAIRRIALLTAEPLPIASGYVSPALNYLGGAAEFPAFKRMKGLGFRHPGFDIHDLTATALALGDAMRGVYWLNLIGPKLLAKIGGMDGLTRLLAHIGVTVESYGDNCASLQLDPTPEVGNVNRSNVPKKYREVAAALREHLKRDEIDFPEFSPDDMDRWHERFLR